MPLTDTAIRNAKPTGKPQKLADTEGLYLYISPTGGKLWRMDYRFAGKRKTLSFGKYPTIGLKDARTRRDEAKKILADGIDPSEQKKVNKRVIIEEERRNQNTFRLVALEWYDTYAPDLSEKHALKLRRYLENVLFEAFGSKVITDIVPADILEAARPAQEKGRIQTAHRLVQLTGQVLQYAVIKGILNVNVAVGITRALQPIRVTNYPAVTDPKEIGRLLRAIDHYEGFPSIVYFLKILPYVFTRPGELRLAEWEEVDFENNLLVIPWHRMKTRKVNKKDHHVPLARQVVALLHELHEFSGNGRFVFPGARAKTDTISDAGPLNALRDLGYPKEVMTLHGFRSTASTRLNEMGYRPDIIETQLAHKDPDAVRMVYNRAQYMDERRVMMQEWADYLTALKEQQ
ncbi:integrase arm-type DNA-binding domain-containing protein [Desulfovibrio sp. OttesenSCG-928-M16]|nr:integrase arm-type DNA-binding domain-containing protein [Desulfovibrio sp. OttesenSCG-928-M16]